jgi:hypothetical protein
VELVAVELEDILAQEQQEQLTLVVEVVEMDQYLLLLEQVDQV